MFNSANFTDIDLKFSMILAETDQHISQVLSLRFAINRLESMHLLAKCLVNYWTDFNEALRR